MQKGRRQRKGVCASETGASEGPGTEHSTAHGRGAEPPYVHRDSDALHQENVTLELLVTHGRAPGASVGRRSSTKQAVGRKLYRNHWISQSFTKERNSVRVSWTHSMAHQRPRHFHHHELKSSSDGQREKLCTSELLILSFIPVINKYLQDIS